MRDTQREEREENVFYCLDQWLDFIWDKSFRPALKKQLFLYKAEKFARELVGDIENCKIFIRFGILLIPWHHIGYISLARVKEAKYLKKNMIKDAKWRLVASKP